MTDKRPEQPAADGLPAQPKPKPERPRDELGRLLPAGSEDRMRLPNFDALSLEENHALAIRFFDEQNFFAAHEAWETCWGLAKGTEEEEFFKGLAQLGAGYTHYRRGNPHGARVLMTRALERIGTHGARHRGIDIDAFRHQIDTTRHTAAALDSVRGARGDLPPLPPQRVPTIED